MSEDPAEGSAPVARVDGNTDDKTKKAGSGRVILTSLLVPILAFVTTLFPWIHANVSSVMSQVDVDVKGTDAAPAVSALGLVALAGVVAVRIAGKVLRAVICAVIALAGAGTAISALTAALNPQDAAMTKVGEATGTNGPGGSYVVTVWPWLTFVLGLATIVVALWLWWSSRQWKTTSRRYERESQHSVQKGDNPHADDIDTWDSLTEGEDPTR